MRASSRDEAERISQGGEPPSVVRGSIAESAPSANMAAGHLHLNPISGHQWAEEVAVPKLVDHSEERKEQSAGS